MQKRTTSRILNDESFIMGLSFNDISGIGIFFLAIVLLFKAFRIESMLIPMTLVTCTIAVLIPIRMKLRRKIVRDYLVSLTRPEVINVSQSIKTRK